MPGSAAGSTTWRIVSERVAPRPNEPSRSDCGTAVIASSESEDTNGMIMTPITRPGGERALRGDVEAERLRRRCAAAGATVSAAKKP